MKMDFVLVSFQQQVMVNDFVPVFLQRQVMGIGFSGDSARHRHWFERPRHRSAAGFAQAGAGNAFRASNDLFRSDRIGVHHD